MANENTSPDATNASPPDTKATKPTIPLHEVKSVSHFADFKPLDKEKANYKTWRNSIEDALTLVGLRPVALGLIPRPESDDAQAAIWDNNDCLARACIRQRLTEAERDHVEDCTTSKAMLDALRKRHRQEGAITQMALLQKTLTARFSKDENILTTARTICDDVDHILEIGFPSKDSFKVIMLLNAMSGDLEDIRNSLDTLLSSDKLDLSAVMRRLEQMAARSTADKTSAETVLAATGGRSKGRTRTGPTCGNCGGYHPTPECFSKGGAMEHKRDEKIAELKAKRAAQAGRKGGSSAATSTPYKGGKRVFDAETGKAFIIVEEETITAGAALSAGDVTSQEELRALAAADDHAPSDGDSDYSLAFAHSQPAASVDWNDACRISEQAFSAIRPQPTPYFYDSGTTSHITYDADDFADLKPITPRDVQGVNGSKISAVAIGTAILTDDDGNLIRLTDALYVPEATIRLISVGKLCDRGYVMEFHDSECSLIDRTTGNLVATGIRKAQGLYAHKGGNLLQDERANIARATPTLETWHRRLGHTNVQTIINMAKGNLVDGEANANPGTQDSPGATGNAEA